MERIIDGKIYNTQTATEVCEISGGNTDQYDFRWESTFLYRSPKDQFFVAGEGGAKSRWSQPVGTNGHAGGSGLYLVTEEQARELCEKHGNAKQFRAVFGEPDEG